MPTLLTERAKALNNDNISTSTKVCFAASDYIYAEQHPNFANSNGGLAGLKHDLGIFVEQWRKQQSDPWDLFSQALNQMIAANRAFLQENAFLKEEYSPEDLLKLFSTLKIDTGRLAGKTTYIARHAVNNACAIVRREKDKLYMLRINPNANIFTVDEFMDCQNANASTAFIDDPSLVFAVKSREDITSKSCQVGIEMLILLGY